MAEPLRKSEEFQENAEDAAPDEREPTLGEEIRARVKHVHKGDVGMPGTNDETFQGSKMRELE
jgi:hypothetical protein